MLPVVLLCSGCVVIFVLLVMRVVEGVILRVLCMCRHCVFVSVVYPVVIVSAVFCVICNC